MVFSRLPLGRGVLVGVGSYLFTYIVAFVAFGSRSEALVSETSVTTVNGQTTVGELLSNTPLPTWKGVGWIFYGGTGVPIQVPGDVKMITVSISPGSARIVPVIMVAVFILGGYWLYGSTSARAGQWKYAGIGISLGYLPLMVAGALIFSIRVKGFTAGPDIIYAILVGLLIPIIAGAIGGKLAE